MQPKKAEVQSFFEFLSGLQHLATAWQRHTQAARAALHARLQTPGIVLRAVGVIEAPENRAPLRLAAPDVPENLAVQSNLSTAEEMAREQTDIREIDGVPESRDRAPPRPVLGMVIAPSAHDAGTSGKCLGDDAGVDLRVPGDWIASWEVPHPDDEP